MKKKIFGSLALGLMCLGLGFLAPKYNVVKAEDTSISESIWEEKIYTYTDEQGTTTLTLISETECTIHLVYEDIDDTRTFNYVVMDNGCIQVQIDTTLVTFILNDDGTLDILDMEEIKACTVTLNDYTHGKVTLSATDGDIGDIVTITLNPDLFYVVGSVTVNGVSLTSENGTYTFALVEGVNTIAVTFVIDSELLGELSVIVDEAANKDWSNLFSMSNVFTLIKWILDGGILIAVIRYYIKDKKLEKKLENTTKETLNSVVPDATKEAVLKSIENFLTPLLTKLGADMATVIEVLGTFCECFVIVQSGDSQAKIAAIEKLSTLKIGDVEIFQKSKAYIEELVAKAEQAYKDTINALDNMGKSEPVIETAKSDNYEKVVEALEKQDNGTQI